MTVSARWGLIGSVAAITGAVAATAVFGDDIERAIDSMADIDTSTFDISKSDSYLKTGAYYIGNAIGWLGDIAAKGLSTVVNLFGGVSTPQDFQTFIGGAVYNDIADHDFPKEYIKAPPASALQTAQQVATQNAVRVGSESHGIGGIISESWDRIANSATGNYVDKAPWQAAAAAGTVVVGAHALGKVADRAEVEIAKGQQQG